jgi:uncharacterized membrane-anchored protein
MNINTDNSTPARYAAAPAMAVGRGMRNALTKVPEVTVWFWVTKILTTGMGESTSDYFVHKFDPAVAVAVSGLVLAMVLFLQFRVKRYIAWVYWSAVVMVSIFGTMAADVLHIGLGIPYVVSTTFFAVAVTVILVTWYLREKTLSIHSIYTHHREAFYWATVLATFALGTAAGDMTATTMHLGYLASGILFAVIFAVPALGYRLLGFNAIFAFWFAYIVTRPLGASFADWMAVSQVRGGLNWGTGAVSLGLTILIIGCVSYLAWSRADIERRPNAKSRR